MGAVRHLELVPVEDVGRRGGSRHLRVVPPGRRRRRSAAVYRRRRLVVALVVVTVVVLAVSAARPPAGEPPVAPTPPRTPTVHVVQPGDTYWSIASSLDREGDVRATVDALVAANGAGTLQVGDRLLLPG